MEEFILPEIRNIKILIKKINGYTKEKNDILNNLNLLCSRLNRYLQFLNSEEENFYEYMNYDVNKYNNL